MPLFTGIAGKLKTKTEDGKRVKIDGVSYYGEIPARVSEEPELDDEGESEEESSEPRPSEDEKFDIDSEAQANTKINAETHLPHPLGRQPTPAQPEAGGAPQTHQNDD